jgi:hypothetical protein
VTKYPIEVYGGPNDHGRCMRDRTVDIGVGKFTRCIHVVVTRGCSNDLVSVCLLGQMTCARLWKPLFLLFLVFGLFAL